MPRCPTGAARPGVQTGNNYNKIEGLPVRVAGKDPKTLSADSDSGAAGGGGALAGDSESPPDSGPSA